MCAGYLSFKITTLIVLQISILSSLTQKIPLKFNALIVQMTSAKTVLLAIVLAAKCAGKASFLIITVTIIMSKMAPLRLRKGGPNAFMTTALLDNAGTLS